jgi:L,D-peptidoglycan transpeptidase YkuD (ErfK/YbiS/YcfS/YnhG family)
MFRRNALLVALLCSTFYATACQTAPVPAEVIAQAERLDDDLRGAGAPIFASEDYTRQLSSLLAARAVLAQEEDRFRLFRDYEKVETRYKAVVTEGQLLLERIRDAKKKRGNDLSKRIVTARDQIMLLREITTTMNEGRLARRSLMRAELCLDDALQLIRKENFDQAERKVADAIAMSRGAEQILGKTVCRYLDSSQIAHWRRSVDSVISESARTGGLAIVIVKLDRQLTVYRDGKAVRTYPVGLGLNGLSDKAYSGDKATPEGRYRIARRVPNSAYYKALLIDYPNDEDRRQFMRNKKNGLVPRGRGPGGNVEIHGGGKDGVTEGCISLDNPEMEQVYNLAGPGTPIVIVGALDENSLFAPVCRVRR